MRRLPVYLVIDCSESMAGEAIQAVEEGIAKMISQLRSDPFALETVWLSVITFSYHAKIHVRLSDITTFVMPPFVLASGTAFGAAIALVHERIKTEVVKSTPERKGDWKPVVFFLTDGNPTDQWQANADKFKREYSNGGANVTAVACGEDASTSNLRRLTDKVILAQDLDSSTVKGLFAWVSASISSGSMALDRSKDVSLDKTEGVAIATTIDDARSIDLDRQVFLQSKCLKNGSHYVMRFRRQLGSADERYQAIASHAVANFDDTAAKDSAGLRVSTANLLGSSPCPVCKNPLWAMCRCGRVHCCPAFGSEGINLTCPWCKKSDHYNILQHFDVGRGFG